MEIRNADVTRSLWPKGKAYARLLKLNNPDLALYPLVTMALSSGQYREPRFWTIMLTFLAFSFCCQALAMVLDDIQGYLDGVDQLGAQGKKKNQPKPLLTGELSVPEARRAAMVLTFLIVLLLTLMIGHAQSPGRAGVALLIAAAVPAQYSFGLKLSYHGLGEIVIIYGATAAAILPYWLLNSTVTLPVVWAALMCGLPFAALVVNSHILDYEADRAKNRRTLAVLLGVRRVGWVAAAFTMLFWLLFAMGLVAGLLPWTAVIWVLLLPAHVRIVRLTLAGDSPAARLLAFRMSRWQLALFVTAFLLALHVFT